jgi:WD40 repeat protein
VSPATTTTLRSAWSHELDDYVTGAQWAFDGGLVAAASLSGRAVVVGANGALVTDLPAHPMGALALDWSPRAQRLAVAGQDGIVRIWEPAGPVVVATEQSAWVEAVAWSPNGAWLAAGAGRTLVVTTPDGSSVREYPDLPSTVRDVAWSGDSRRVCAATYGGPQWFEPGRASVAPTNHLTWKGSLLRIAVAPSGKWLASGNQDRSVHVWRLWSGDDFQMTGYPTKIEAIAWSPSSRFLAVGSAGDVTLWDFAGRGPQGTTPRVLDGFSGKVGAMAYSHRGPHLAAVTGDALLAIWDPDRSTTPIATVALGAAGSTLAWHPSDDAVLVGTVAGTVTRFDLG